MLRELSVVEQRYRAVLEVAAGVLVTEVAGRYVRPAVMTRAATGLRPGRATEPRAAGLIPGRAGLNVACPRAGVLRGGLRCHAPGLAGRMGDSIQPREASEMTSLRVAAVQAGYVL